MKKNICWMLIALMLAALLVGCASNAPAAPAATDAPTEPEGMYIQFRGTKAALGMKYADVKDGFGAESAPAQDIIPCDGNEANKTILHIYPGFSVMENTDGVIIEMEISDLYEGESDAAFMGTVKLGTTQEEAIAALGEPTNYPLPEDDYGLLYGNDSQYICVFLNPDDNKQTVSGVSMILAAP